jgi:hypothetical protein
MAGTRSKSRERLKALQEGTYRGSTGVAGGAAKVDRSLRDKASTADSAQIRERLKMERAEGVVRKRR